MNMNPWLVRQRADPPRWVRQTFACVSVFETASNLRCISLGQYTNLTMSRKHPRTIAAQQAHDVLAKDASVLLVCAYEKEEEQGTLVSYLRMALSGHRTGNT